MNKPPAKNFLLVLVGLSAGGVLLTLIQPPFNLSFLAWVAYVPLILVAVSIKKIRPAVFASYIAALIYWLGNIYWISSVTISGWITFCAYTALLWPVLIVTLKFCNEKKIPLFIAAPILLVGIEQLQGFLLGGFYWRHLSHSQYANITLIQIADIFGAAGVSFLIAMVNGLIVELVLAAKNKCLIKPVNFVKVSVVIAVLTATILYGRWRIDQSQTTIEAGPVVGVVQSNLPQTIKDSNEFDVTAEVFEGLLALSRNCASAGAKLVIWPETIVPEIMDKAVWPFLYEPEKNIYFHKALGEHAREGVYVLIGAPGGEVNYENNYEASLDKYNSAFLYEPTGDQTPLKYDKIHLVPFGEIVPFKQSAPLLYKFLMMFSPYDFDYNLTPGDQYTIFECNMASDAAGNFIHGHDGRAANTYRFGVMICYEGTVPYIARRFAVDNRADKQVDWLVNISNDGWFVRFKDGKALASTELAQHTACCVFRAVENRLSVIRSVNTGISCLIDPVGRLKNGYSAGNLPQEAMARKAVAGWFTENIPIDSRVSIFSRFGQWLDWGCKIAVFAVLFLLLAGRFGRKKKYERKQNSPK